MSLQSSGDGQRDRPWPDSRTRFGRHVFRPALSSLLALAVLVSGLLAAPRAYAWGKVGHRASARLTESRLTPAALAAVKELLEPGETLADASTWADEMRKDNPETAPWHYVNVPITEDKYSDRFCGAKGCVVAKVDEFRKQLADPSLPRADRQKALRFLTHFLQDMHQPVHVGDRGDRGGNDTQVQFFGKGSNLHRVWDSGIIEQSFPDESALLRELTARAAGLTTAAEGTTVDWADESLAAARDAYKDPTTGAVLKKGAKLGTTYQEAGLPVATRRLTLSALRLAAVLNSTLDPAGAAPKPQP